MKSFWIFLVSFNFSFYVHGQPVDEYLSVPGACLLPFMESGPGGLTFVLFIVVGGTGERHGCASGSGIRLPGFKSSCHLEPLSSVSLDFPIYKKDW